MPNESVVTKFGKLEFLRSSKEGEVSLCCPFCEMKGLSPDTKFHLNFNDSKGLLYCYRCHFSGNASVLFENRKALFVPPTKKALYDLFEKVSETIGFTTLPFKSDTYDLKEYGIEPFEGSKGLDYLLFRQLTRQDIEFYKVLLGVGFYKNRIIIPVIDDFGICTYFVARSYDDSNPRYKNPPTAKSGLVFNANNLKKGGLACVCEGSFSAIYAGKKLYNLGYAASPYDCSCATLGSYVHNDQAKIITGRASKVFLCFDSDRTQDEKHKEAFKIARLGVATLFINLPVPNSLALKKNDPGTVTDFEFQSAINTSVFVDGRELLVCSNCDKVLERFRQSDLIHRYTSSIYCDEKKTKSALLRKGKYARH